MKERMTSVDLAAVLAELNEIKDAKVEKSYQLTKNELLIKLYHFNEGKKNLMIESGKRIHFTEYPRPAPERPPDFPMILRKYTKGANIRGFRQHNFDRVLEIKMEKEKEYYLICELFGKGNIVLTDKNHKIIAALKREKFKDRDIRKDKEYSLPPSNVNPIELNIEEFKKILNESNSDVVRTIATKLNLGGTYAEEICFRANINKNKETKDLSQSETKSLFNSLKKIMNSIKQNELDPHIVYENNQTMDVLPIFLKKYKENEKKEFDSFNEALDNFFSKREINEVETKKENVYQEKINSLKGRKQSQLATVKQYKKDYEDGIKKGDLIYKYYQELNDLMNLIEKAREKYDWKKIKEKIKEGKEKDLNQAKLVQEINQEKAELVVKLDNYEVTLDIRKSLTKNAKNKYEEAKKKKRKSKGAKKAAKKTQEKIEEIKSKGKESFEVRETPQKKIRNKKHWYDKYRWFISSDNLLVIGGRNADQNEEIVKNHMQKGDLFFHSQIEGGSATIVKAEGKEIPEKTKKEAAKFAASNSEAWKNYYSADIYQVKPNQVTKTPESGEYIQKGSFVIRGNRKYYRNIELKYAVGVEINDLTRVIGGPPSAIKKHSKYYKEIVPGNKDRGEISEKIMKEIKEKAEPEEERVVEKIVTPDELERFFPPGKLRLKNED